MAIHDDITILTIGGLSKRTGVHLETVRYYEAIGIMPKPPRTPVGHRRYDLAHLKRLTFVKRSRELGFTLKEIRALLALVDGGDYTCAEVHDLTVSHLHDVREKSPTFSVSRSPWQIYPGNVSAAPFPRVPLSKPCFDN